MALIQIRDVPDEVRDELKARAAAAGQSLNTYMLRLVEREASRTTNAELMKRIRARGPLITESTAPLVRQLRDEQDQRWRDRWSS